MLISYVNAEHCCCVICHGLTYNYKKVVISEVKVLLFFSTIAFVCHVFLINYAKIKGVTPKACLRFCAIMNQ